MFRFYVSSESISVYIIFWFLFTRIIKINILDDNLLYFTLVKFSLGHPTSVRSYHISKQNSVYSAYLNV